MHRWGTASANSCNAASIAFPLVVAQGYVGAGFKSTRFGLDGAHLGGHAGRGVSGLGVGGGFKRPLDLGNGGHVGRRLALLDTIQRFRPDARAAG